MAISLQWVIQSTSCLVLGWDFRGHWIEQHYFGTSSWIKSKVAVGGLFEKFQISISYLQQVMDEQTRK